jgi:hypothetical protein
MDSTHVALALSGLGAGWVLFGQREAAKVDPPACHCVCSIKPESQPGSEGSYLLVTFVAIVIIVFFGTQLFLVFRVSVKQGDSGEKEYTFSVKGKSGKGVYGASRGLQILDR